MSYEVIISLAVIDFALGIMLFVTIRQIQTLTTAINAVDKIAREAKATAVINRRRIDDCCKEIQRISRDTHEAYTLAAECRNELTRLHMAERKETSND